MQRQTHPKESHRRQPERCPQNDSEIVMLLGLEASIVNLLVAGWGAVDILDEHSDGGVAEDPTGNETGSKRPVLILSVI